MTAVVCLMRPVGSVRALVQGLAISGPHGQAAVMNTRSALLLSFVSLACASSTFARAATAEDVKKCKGYDIPACQAVIDDAGQSAIDRSLAYVRRGNQSAGKGHNDAAFADFDKAVGLAPASADALRGRAKSYQAKGEIDRAIADFSKAVDLEPNESESRLGRALAYKEKREWGSAIRDMERVVESDKDAADPYFVLAGIYADKGDSGLALKNYAQSLMLDPMEVEYRTGRAAYCAAHGELDGAIFDLSYAISVDRSAASAFAQRAGLFARRGDIVRALADFDAAIQIEPKSAGLYLSRAATLAEAGRADAAMTDYDEAVRLAPTTADPLLARGAARAGMSNLDAALADYDSAIRIAPNAAPAYRLRAFVHAARGNYDKAIADHTTSIGLQPNAPYGYVLRAWTHLKAGKVELGLADAEKAVAMKPELASAFAVRGQALEALGRKEQAIASFQKALKIAPGLADARDALTRLAAPPPPLPPAPSADRATGGPLDDKTWVAQLVREEPTATTMRRKRPAIFVRNIPAYAYPVVQVSREKSIKVAARVRYREQVGCGVDPESANETWYKVRTQAGQEGYVSARDLGEAELRSASVTSSGKAGDVFVAADIESQKASYEFAAASSSRQKKYERAIGYYSRLIEMDPDNSRFYNGRAWAYFEAGQSRTGLPDAQRAVELAADDAAALDTRAHIFEALGRRSDAIADYRKALSIDPKSTTSKEGLKRLGAGT